MQKFDYRHDNRANRDAAGQPQAVQPAVHPEAGAPNGLQPGGEAGRQAGGSDHLPQGHTGRGEPPSRQQGLSLPQRQGSTGTATLRNSV